MFSGSETKLCRGKHGRAWAFGGTHLTVSALAWGIPVRRRSGPRVACRCIVLTPQKAAERSNHPVGAVQTWWPLALKRMLKRSSPAAVRQRLSPRLRLSPWPGFLRGSWRGVVQCHHQGVAHRCKARVPNPRHAEFVHGQIELIVVEHFPAPLPLRKLIVRIDGIQIQHRQRLWPGAQPKTAPAPPRRHTCCSARHGRSLA